MTKSICKPRTSSFGLSNEELISAIPVRWPEKGAASALCCSQTGNQQPGERAAAFLTFFLLLELRGAALGKKQQVICLLAPALGAPHSYGTRRGEMGLTAIPARPPAARRQTKEKGCPIPAQPLPTASPLTSACALAVPAASGSLGIASHSIPALCSPWHGAGGYFRCAPLSFPRPPSAGHSAGKTSVPGRAEREGRQEMCLERAAPQSPSLDG